MFSIQNSIQNDVSVVFIEPLTEDVREWLEAAHERDRHGSRWFGETLGVNPQNTMRWVRALVAADFKLGPSASVTS
jgi:hypothetical protein